MKQAILIIGLSVFLVYHVSAQRSKSTFIRESFEQEFLNKAWGKEGKEISRSDEKARTGKYSLKIELNRKNAWKSTSGSRAEIKLKPESTPDVERWYKFSIFLPEDYETDAASEILAQWHEMPDRHLGETWRSPPISLRVTNGKWEVVVLWAEDELNTNETISGSKTLELGEVVPGKWTDWVFNIRFSHKEDGILKIWKNNVKELDLEGPNYYNDVRGPYFKLGIYKWEWRRGKSISTSKNRVLYFDDIEVCSSKEDCDFNLPDN